MPLYAVVFEDDPTNAAEIRSRHMTAHLAFLDRHAAAIRAAGPLREGSANAAPFGGLWLVEAADPVAVDVLIREDPFWPTGLRRLVRIAEWLQVFADGKRLS